MDCTDSIYVKSTHYFFMAVFATIMYVILTLNIVHDSLRQHMPEALIYVFKLFILFGSVYVADRYIEKWKIYNIICK